MELDGPPELPDSYGECEIRELCAIFRLKDKKGVNSMGVIKGVWGSLQPPYFEEDVLTRNLAFILS